MKPNNENALWKRASVPSDDQSTTGQTTMASAGLLSVDRMIGGGLPFGGVGVVCHGKEIVRNRFGLQIGRRNAELGHQTRFILSDNAAGSWKMDQVLGALRHEGFDRRSRRKAGLSEVRSTADYVDLFKRFRAECENLDVWYCEGRSPYHTIDGIERKLRQEKKRGVDVKVIILDQLGKAALMPEILAQCKRLAEDWELAIWMFVGTGCHRSHGWLSTKLTRELSSSADIWLGLGNCQYRLWGRSLTIRYPHGHPIDRTKVGADWETGVFYDPSELSHTHTEAC